jgi:lipopolysaccharide export system protein LptC
MSKRWLPALAWLALALATGWLVRELSPDSPDAQAKANRSPDMYLDNFTSTVMDAAGRPHRRLTAKHMAHFPDTNTSELEYPYLRMYRLDEPPWHVRSERGWVSANGEVVLLTGEVHIWRDTEAGKRMISIDTRDLRILTESDFGETDKPVVITRPTNTSRGVGMRAYLQQGRVELLSRVQTVYEQPDE